MSKSFTMKEKHIFLTNKNNNVSSNYYLNAWEFGDVISPSPVALKYLRGYINSESEFATVFSFTVNISTLWDQEKQSYISFIIAANFKCLLPHEFRVDPNLHTLHDTASRVIVNFANHLKLKSTKDSRFLKVILLPKKCPDYAGFNREQILGTAFKNIMDTGVMCPNNNGFATPYPINQAYRSGSFFHLYDL